MKVHEQSWNFMEWGGGGVGWGVCISPGPFAH
jgi:hypothetical protein